MQLCSAVEKLMPAARNTLTFLAHQAVGAWGPIYVAPWAAVLVGELKAHMGFQTSIAEVQWALYGTPFYPIQIALALLAGWTLSGTLRHRSILWVWMLPLIGLALALGGIQILPSPSHASTVFPNMSSITIPQVGGLNLGTRLSVLFGWGIQVQPFSQVTATLPLYTAVAYSVGGGLARTVLNSPVFFETLRGIRKVRLFLFVAMPWFCLKLAFNWRGNLGRYPVLHLWPAMRVYFQGLMIAAILVATAFALVIGLAGRRFALTRFFLEERVAGRLGSG